MQILSYSCIIENVISGWTGLRLKSVSHTTQGKGKLWSGAAMLRKVFCPSNMMLATFGLQDKSSFKKYLSPKLLGFYLEDPSCGHRGHLSMECSDNTFPKALYFFSTLLLREYLSHNENILHPVTEIWVTITSSRIFPPGSQKRYVFLVFWKPWDTLTSCPSLRLAGIF